jgi:putative ATP-dependent endonuclease of the OLD family
MKLDKVKIRNFRGFRNETEIHLNSITAFIGRNDAGKSTILEALEIFFNNKTVVCEKDDLSKFADDRDIEISCFFSNIPQEVVIDTAFPTSLSDEYLLNRQGELEIKKVFAATAKPKANVFICCNHPLRDEVANLLNLKRADLRIKADELGISRELYDRNINASIRKAIRDSFDDLQLSEMEILVDEEDTKKVFSKIQEYLPIYALFQSDRRSTDDDREVTDPMKAAVSNALGELENELNYIKDQVRIKALATAARTLEKLREMDPELAQQLEPEYKSEPCFASLFKLKIKSENDIPINKRGSGVRRLILLNFFRSEAERRLAETESNSVIYAFEEPETSQHPDHQEILITAFMQLAETQSTQIILTTHTPALASLLPLESLRYIEFVEGDRIVESGTEEVFAKVAESLGVLPDPIPKDSAAVLLVEGKGDVVFVQHTAEQLKAGEYIPRTLEEARIAVLPIGGCGNIKHWQTKNLIDQFGIPYCVLLDSDLGTNEEEKNREKVANLHAEGIKAYLTKKREPENYICVDCLELENGVNLTILDDDDAKSKINGVTRISKTLIIETFWTKMTFEQIREAETYIEGDVVNYEFSEMFNDFLSLVEE